MGATTPRRLGIDSSCLEMLLAGSKGDSVRRYLKFLPFALFALALQILAPVMACWAAGIGASDPLQSVEICHTISGATSGQSDQGGGQDGACAICCVVQASASIDAPQQTAFTVPYRQTARVDWTIATLDLSPPRAGSSTQARAPPLPM
jgi:hypothetical protein